MCPLFWGCFCLWQEDLLAQVSIVNASRICQGDFYGWVCFINDSGNTCHEKWLQTVVSSNCHSLSVCLDADMVHQIWSTQHFFHQMFILPTYFFALQLWFTPFIPHCEKHLISMVYWLSFSDIHYKLSLINIWMHLYTPPPPFCSVFPLVCLIFCAPHTPSPPSPCNLLCYWVSVREDELALVFILTWALASHI